MSEIKRESEKDETPHRKIQSMADLDRFIGKRVSVNPVGGGPENPHVREGEPRIVGILQKGNYGYWINCKDGGQEITARFFPFQEPRVEE